MRRKPRSAKYRLEDDGAIVIRLCPRCRQATDADGRCGACRLVLPTAPHRGGPGGGEPWRTCPAHGTRTLAADGWCNPRPGGGAWHVAGPRLERVQREYGPVYEEREVPVPLPKAEVRERVAALVEALGRPMPRVTAAEVVAAERGEAWEPELAPAQRMRLEARQRLLAAQAAALRSGHEEERT